MSTTVAVIFIVVFVIGAVVGGITVIAMAAVRRDRTAALPYPDPADSRDPEDLLDHGYRGYGIPGRWDGALGEQAIDEQQESGPRWPGGDDSSLP